MRLFRNTASAAVLVGSFFLSSSWAQDQSAATQDPTDHSSANQSTAAAQDSKDQSTVNQTPVDAASSSGNSPAAQSSADDSSQQPPDDQQDKAKRKRSGGKDDVDAIGNRNVGARGLGDWYGTEKEIQMGKQYAQQVEQTVKLVQDPVVTEYVNRVGQNIVRNSDAKVPFTIKVVDSDEINAFALPGGFFYVNSGLILAADNEAEMAGVMAHEIAHVAARHAMRQLTRAQWANISTIPLIFIGGGLGYGIYSASSIALPLTFLHFSRGFESEADYLGLQYMYKSGYDPQSFIDFFEKIEAKEKKKPGTLAKAFSTHPQTPDRIEKSQEEIAKVLPPRPEYVVTTSEFDDVKTRLAAIENRHKLTDQKDTNKPTLRRSTADNTGNKGDSGNNDDDRPTLHRRDD